MTRSRVLLSAIFATLGVALAGCAATPIYPGYYPGGDPVGTAEYYCGDAGAWDIGAWGGRRNCVGPIYRRAGHGQAMLAAIATERRLGEPPF
jgi:hypothetical protein